MRVLAGIFCLLMLLFTVVQYNDPDALHWVAIYGVAAVLCGLAAWRPVIVGAGPGGWLLLLAIALAVYGVWFYWPDTPGFWHQEVWWNTETAREGMGVMIVLLALLVALAAARRSRA